MKEDAILIAARLVIEKRKALEDAEDRRRAVRDQLLEVDREVRVAGDESHLAWEQLSSLLRLDEEVPA